MSAFIGLLKGFAMGVSIVLAFVLLLALLSRAVSAHEILRINEAQGPIDFDYHGHEHNEAIMDMMVIHLTPHGIPVYMHVDQEEAREWCSDSNAYLRVLKANLDAEAKKNPGLAELYAPGYESIARAWCK